MPNWTKEQLDAIESTGSNIIVSAGAGSGKTAVLTERVIRKLKQGIHIDQLLVLTFTKNAALEMKERIRKAILKEPSLKGELDLLDGAYITTFDSFALSIVRRYHDLKNLKKDVQIAEETLLILEKKKRLDALLDSYYEKEDARWQKLVSTFFVKDDEPLRQALYTMYLAIDMRYDKKTYLEQYVANHYQPEYIDQGIMSFVDDLKKRVASINPLLLKLETEMEGDYVQKLREMLKPLLASTTYEEIRLHSAIRLPNLPKNGTLEAKASKEAVCELVKSIQEVAIYESTAEMKAGYQSTQEFVELIIEILEKLDAEVMRYKQEQDLYEFNDIAKMAIDIVASYPEIQKEMRERFQEILVDEYQDTNDVQEKLLSLFSKDNIYMVGDIKQSIYRFRNANPYIFKEKYDAYAQSQGGKKIDLNKNFRSRKETLEDINLIFDILMDDALGGADYKHAHEMIFGNLSYSEQGATDVNHNLEIYNYLKEKGDGFTEDEYEAFIIVEDIIKKVKEHYPIYDKDEGKVRSVRYDDFVILLDRATKFDIYKKIFEYKNVPLALYKDENIASSLDIAMFKNCLRLILSIKKGQLDDAFRYAFMSVGRSFLVRYSDQELFTYFKDQSYEESSLYQKAKAIADQMDTKSCAMVLEEIAETFNYYQKLPTVGDVENRMLRFDYLKKMSRNLEELGYGVEEFLEYMETVLEHDLALKVSVTNDAANAVKMMTIHKSKGLEYFICYYAGLSNRFNMSDLNDWFLYDKTYGFLIPYMQEGVKPTFYKQLLKNDYLKEEISEKIRLFYVALTRCKEKMIIVAPLGESEEYTPVLSYESKLHYRSFLDMIKSIEDRLTPFMKSIGKDEIPLTKAYNFTRNDHWQQQIARTEESVEVEEYTFSPTYKETLHYSKSTDALFNRNVDEIMKIGTEMHYLLEMIDLKDPKLDTLPISDFQKEKLSNFITQPLIQAHRNDAMYHEYEFLEEEEQVRHHGIIDLLIVENEEVLIIDYKLRNIKDPAYVQQLQGYKRWIEKHFHKQCSLYLYSILDDRMEKVVEETAQDGNLV